MHFDGGTASTATDKTIPKGQVRLGARLLRPSIGEERQHSRTGILSTHTQCSWRRGKQIARRRVTSYELSRKMWLIFLRSFGSCSECPCHSPSISSRRTELAGLARIIRKKACVTKHVEPPFLSTPMMGAAYSCTIALPGV